METNASRYAQHARPDKVRLKYGPQPQDAMEAELSHVLHQLASGSGDRDVGYFRERVALYPWRMDGEVMGWTIQLHDEAAANVYYLEERYIGRVSEVEAKAYVDPLGGNPDMVEAFMDALQASRGVLRLTIDQPSKRQGPKKKGASRHARMGTEKSSTSISAYARKGERLGINVGSRKVRLAKIRSDIMQEYVNRSGPGLSTGAGWGALVYRVALAAFQFYEKELTIRGVSLAAFFGFFTDVADLNLTGEHHPGGFTRILSASENELAPWELDGQGGLGTVPAVDGQTGEVLGPPLPDRGQSRRRRKQQGGE